MRPVPRISASRRSPDCLERIEPGPSTPRPKGRSISERRRTAVFDGRSGRPLARARPCRGPGRRKRLANRRGPGAGRERRATTGSAAGVAAEMAVGPVAALILGPGALVGGGPSDRGGAARRLRPALRLNWEARRDGRTPRRSARPARPSHRRSPPGPPVLAPDDGWLVAAVSVTAMESLSTFHERVADTLHGLDEADGRLLPVPWEARRREAREHGRARPTPRPGRRSGLGRAARRRGPRPARLTETRSDPAIERRPRHGSARLDSGGPRKGRFQMVLPLGDLEKTRIVPIVTYALIALNVVMYLVQRERRGRLHDRLRRNALRDHPQRRHPRPGRRRRPRHG